MDPSSIHVGPRIALEKGETLRIWEMDTFTPTEPIPQQLQVQYGMRDQQEFNRFSLETTEICAARMREALMRREDLRKLYFSLNEFLGERRRKLAHNSPLAEQFGKPREACDVDHFHTGFGPGTPYPEEGNKIAQLLSKSLNNQGESLTKSDQREATTFKVQVITPALFQELKEQIRQKYLLQKPLDETEKVNLDILDMCTSFVSHKLLDGNEGVVINGVVNCNQEQMRRIRDASHFIVGQVLFHPNRNETIPLTAFITGGRKMGGHYALEQPQLRIIGLHPPISALIRLQNVLADQFVEILQWDRKDRNVFNARIARFTYLYAGAMQFLRGTGWVLQVETKAFYKLFDFILVKYARGVQLDRKAFETHHLQDFVDRYLTFYAEDPTGRSRSL